MTEVTVSIKNRAGIHARPAALIVQTASKYASKIWLEKGGDRSEIPRWPVNHDTDLPAFRSYIERRT